MTSPIGSNKLNFLTVSSGGAISALEMTNDQKYLTRRLIGSDDLLDTYCFDTVTAPNSESLVTATTTITYPPALNPGTPMMVSQAQYTEVTFSDLNTNYFNLTFSEAGVFDIDLWTSVEYTDITNAPLSGYIEANIWIDGGEGSTLPIYADHALHSSNNSQDTLRGGLFKRYRVTVNIGDTVSVHHAYTLDPSSYSDATPTSTQSSMVTLRKVAITSQYVPWTYNNIGFSESFSNCTTPPLPAIALAMRVVTASWLFLNPTFMTVRRGSDNATMDWNFTSNGYPDFAALYNFVGTSDAFVVRWYDQSPNANDAVQTNPNRQPYIMKAGVLQGFSSSKPGFSDIFWAGPMFDSSVSGQERYLTLTTPLNFSNSASSGVWDVQFSAAPLSRTPAFAANAKLPLIGGATGALEVNFVANSSGSVASPAVAAGPAGSAPFVTHSPSMASSSHLIGIDVYRVIPFGLVVLTDDTTGSMLASNRSPGDCPGLVSTLGYSAGSGTYLHGIINEFVAWPTLSSFTIDTDQLHWRSDIASFAV